MMQSNATFVNALSFFTGKEFCGMNPPPIKPAEDCKAFATWFTKPAFTVLGELMGLSQAYLCQLNYDTCK